MKLEELEARLQSLIEVHLVGALTGKNAEDLIVHKLAAAIQSNAITQQDGTRLAPNVYNIIVPAKTLKHWQDPHLSAGFLDIIKIAGQDAGLKFDYPPVITFTPDAGLSTENIDLVASYRVDEPMEDTKNMPADSEEGTVEDNSFPENAFLIVEGVKVVPLNLPVVNIGRRLDNTVVIEDPRVSRNHAQLRAIKGRYVLFDLNSTGGTFINGQRTNQTVLYPGDVISLAGVAVIFGQDNPPPRPDLKPTSPLNGPSADRPTAVLRTMPPAKKKKGQ